MSEHDESNITPLTRKPFEEPEPMSEEALLAMSDDDYMNDQQKSYFTWLLKKEWHELNQDIISARHQMTLPKEADPLDAASDQELFQIQLRTMERNTKLLHKVEKSLALIKDDDYGFCEETGEPIGVGRLLARPTATMSIIAKEKREFQEQTEGKAGGSRTTDIPPEAFDALASDDD